jgi:hypothetical protein
VHIRITVNYAELRRIYFTYELFKNKRLEYNEGGPVHLSQSELYIFYYYHDTQQFFFNRAKF